MLTLVGAFAGIRLLGAVGAFLGPLILSFMMELVRAYEELTHLPEPTMPARRDSCARTLQEAQT